MIAPIHAMLLREILLFAATGALLVAMLCDVAFRLIPDFLPLVLVGLGIALHLLDGTLPAALAGGAGVFALALLCWLRGWMGGGDVKLLAAVAVLLRPMRVPGFIAAVALAGGALALIYLVLERLSGRVAPRPAGRTAPRLRRILAIERRRIARRLSLPYATAIGAAALLTMFEA